MSENKKMAVYFDCENVSADFVDFVFEFLKPYNVIAKHAFKDWSKENCWNQALLEKYAITPQQVFNNNFGKNGADIAIATEVMEEILSKKVAQSIVLVSSDSDFTHLTQKIRANGIEAIGFGESKAPNRLRNAYNIFIEFPPKSDIVEESQNKALFAKSKTLTLNEGEKLSLLIQAIEAMHKDGWCNMAKIGDYLKCQSLSVESFGESWKEVLGRYPHIFTLKHTGNQNTTLQVGLK
ncbi:NYN domain-containing protein [Helicobacter sp. 23-1048]